MATPKKTPAKKAAPATKPVKKAAAKEASAQTKPRLAGSKASPQTGASIDAFVDALEAWQQDIVRPFAALVAKVAPEALAYIKWGHPVWDHRGPFALVKAYTAHVNIGFWRGGQLSDAEGVLEGDGDKMKYLKVKSGQTLPPSLATLVREAVALYAKHGDPLKR